MPSPTADPRRLRVGTRGSALARYQTALVVERLGALGWQTELVPIVTAGDRRPPDTAWGEGAFVGALREALLDGAIDLAVHSAKDVPLDGPSDLAIAAYLDRQDPRDALVLRTEGRAGAADRGRVADQGEAPLAGLPRGARVGTDSPRRAGFLRAARPDLRIVPLHGNVDTRLRRLDAGEVDALVLAAAGLVRLGRADRITAWLPLDLVPPAPGQGALAVETRAGAGDPRPPAPARAAVAVDALAALDEPSVRRAVEAERLVLDLLGGGCRAPIGVAAHVEADGGAGRGDEAGVIEILAGVVEPDGRDRRVVVRRGPVTDWVAVAAEVADLLRPGSRPPRAAAAVLETRGGR
ncbi:MAG TPA: hydroxymethylbilane synthase [Candidatus Binatia bacterium]|nr:hydroxymethylbilane synthase [Candidatus Binatia bacterium]